MSTATDDDPVAFPFERLMALSAGAAASQLDVMTAGLNQTLKHRNWLMARDLLDEGAAASLSDRADRERARIRWTYDRMMDAAASPTPEAGAMVFAGRLLDDGAPRADLVVSALDRTGKALACATSDDIGNYRVVIDGKHEGDATLMVASAKGRRLFVDDRVTPLAPGGIARIDLDIGRGAACPDGPDRSGQPVMPDVIGHDLDEAAALLKRAGIAVAEVKAVERAGAEGKVVATDPPAGRLVGDPAEARLTVGRPDAGRWKPGMVRAMAARAAIDDGLPEERVTAMFDAMAAKGDIDTATLADASTKSDRAFAAQAGLKLAEAKVARAALARTLDLLGVDRDPAG